MVPATAPESRKNSCNNIFLHATSLVCARKDARQQTNDKADAETREFLSRIGTKMRDSA